MESKPTDDIGSLAASFPLLVYDHGEQPDNSQTLLSVADGSSHTYRVPELRGGYRCLETPRGLVLVADTTSFLSYLWNPQTGETITLPAMDKALPEDCRCLLSDTVSSPDCLVLVYDLTDPELLFCRVSGGCAWISQSYDIGLYKLPADAESYSVSAATKKAISNMAAVQGRFYIMETLDEVGVLSFARHPDQPPHLELTSFGAPMPTMDSEAPQVATMTYLLESDQDLFLVCIFFLGCSLERIEEVGAYKMDFSRKEWCKVTDIGDRAFLLGAHSFAASCSAEEHGLKRGCVYFALDFFGDSNDYHIFDLQEGTRQLAGPPKDVPLPAREPFWMVPVFP
ncbi:hypothetical protein BDA96_03G060400 [Sorghum bicolor]|uniref:KIB1-4 beta-propeller domain-containing protein n=2 Tax=Sorghum bicolor TaxID=4558 RepID=A0A921R9H4_SORBI|nr:uncharacterized protein LOC8078503 [Sorghum bicolor]XP_021311659.1 uncharacterized protein LOC8078503 [Sorghum bicolor]EES00249.1 hypothetical protein SORBI_3003G056400 [Sorghum bicolor]KAG0536399.1 hypothetical protein BDA96_03G060400 [Sorghum bicolor]KAG0536400.1 hypothetical protein BDA96_03G060400 [Sorghum bicolor]|eukprot:XP_021311657.1 uncharacterized protein LOC8078503 [Sorghum bicolor]